MIEYAEFFCSFGLTSFIGSLILMLYMFAMLNDTNKKTYDAIDNITNEYNLIITKSKYTERQKFVTLVQMRLNAYNAVLKSRQECIKKLENKMSLSLDDIIDTYKTIKKFDNKLQKYNRKMAPYGIFQSMFALPQKNEYIPLAEKIVATNGTISKGLDGKSEEVQCGDTNTESGISSVSLDNSPARS